MQHVALLNKEVSTRVSRKLAPSHPVGMETGTASGRSADVVRITGVINNNSA